MDFTIGAGYLTPSSPTYDGRRDSTMSEHSTSSYGHSFDNSGGSAYLSPHLSPPLQHTPDPMRDMLNGAAVLNTPHHLHGHKQYGYFPDPQTRRGPPVHLPNQAWTLQTHMHGRHDGHLPPSPVAVHGQEILRQDGSDYPSSYSALGLHKSVPQTMVPPSEYYSSSEEWPPSPDPTYPIAQDVFPAYPVTTTGPRSYNWPATVSTSDSFAITSYDHNLIPSTSSYSSNSSIYARVPSEGYDADQESQYQHRQLYSGSPIPHSMPLIKDRRRHVSGHDHFGQAGSRISRRQVRTPLGFKGTRKERHESSSSRRRAKTIKTDMGFLHARDGTRIPVQLQGEFKKDSDGKWTGTGGDSQKHICQAVKGGDRCSRTFKRIEHLRRHMRTHTQDQPFSCDFPTERLEDGQVQHERCNKQFQRNDNCVAHFKTHVSQDKNGLYFPEFRPEERQLDNASNEWLVNLAETITSNIHADDRKKGSRNPRVTWEDFMIRLKGIKTPEETSKIVASVFKSCLKDDEKTRNGGR